MIDLRYCKKSIILDIIFNFRRYSHSLRLRMYQMMNSNINQFMRSFNCNKNITFTFISRNSGFSIPSLSKIFNAGFFIYSFRSAITIKFKGYTIFQFATSMINVYIVVNFRDEFYNLISN